MRHFIYLALMVFVTTANSHSGRTDSNGGHNERKTGEYHCHSEPCISNHRKSNTAYQKAVNKDAAYSSLYDRDDWPHWIDEDRDCQDLRAEILISTSSVPVTFKQAKGCVVTQGRWFDPYTGKTFTRAKDLDIDHIIPLKEAHISGGNSWSRKQRRTFANDPDNLIVVSARENREKGAKDLSNWLPDRLAYRCDYVEKWIDIKIKYGLGMDLKEKRAAQKALNNCD